MSPDGMSKKDFEKECTEVLAFLVKNKEVVEYLVSTGTATLMEHKKKDALAEFNRLQKEEPCIARYWNPTRGQKECKLEIERCTGCENRAKLMAPTP